MTTSTTPEVELELGSMERLEGGLGQVAPGALDVAASILVVSALALRRRDSVVVIDDDASRNIGRAICRAAQRLGAVPIACNLDRFGARPLVKLPGELQARLAEASASVFVATCVARELELRQALLRLVPKHGLRHGHLPGISELAFQQGMRVDYARVARAGEQLLQLLRGVRKLECTAPHGTEIEVALPEHPQWSAQLGELQPGRWGNLPAGCLYTTPLDVNGIFVANASLGTELGRSRQARHEQPVSLCLRAGKVVRVECADQGLRAQLEALFAHGPNSDRVGLVALGVNAGLVEAAGESLVDQNLPGLHLAIGDPAVGITGAEFSAKSSIAACQFGSSVRADGAPLIRRGRLLDDN